MFNETGDATTDPIGWIVVPVILGVLLYGLVALFVWPYARPVVPLSLLFLFIFFPPLFPFLFLFVLFTLCTPPSAIVGVPTAVYVIPSSRARPPPRSSDAVRRSSAV